MRRNWIARFTQHGKQCRDALQSEGPREDDDKGGGASLFATYSIRSRLH